jgi:hypothetical protein
MGQDVEGGNAVVGEISLSWQADVIYNFLMPFFTFLELSNHRRG